MSPSDRTDANTPRLYLPREVNQDGTLGGDSSSPSPGLPRAKHLWRVGIREAAADRWAELEINIALWEIDPEFHRRRGSPPLRARDISEEELPLSPHYLVGDPEEMIDTLRARRERWGISYVTLPASALTTLEPVIARLAG